MPRDEEKYRRKIEGYGSDFSSSRDNILKSIETEDAAKRNLAEKVATMQFGSATPIAGQPGMFQGAYGRHDLAQERMNTATVGAQDRRTVAETPMWTGSGAYHTALADESKFKLGMGQELRPEALASARSTHGINTALNQGEILNKQDEIFGKANTRALALPEHSIPYQKVAPTQDRGWAQKLWQGDLFGTNPMMSDINTKENLRRKKIAGMNESFLAQEPSYRY